MAAQRALNNSMTQLKFKTKQKCLENMIRYYVDLVIYVFCATIRETCCFVVNRTHIEYILYYKLNA